MQSPLTYADIADLIQDTPDAVVIGNGDMFELLGMVYSDAEKWAKVTRAMQTPAGCIVKDSILQRDNQGLSVISEAMAFVPGVKVLPDPDHPGGRKLVFAKV